MPDEAQAEAGGSAQQQIDLTAPEVQAAIQKAVEESTRAEKAKISEFRDNNIELQKRLKAWDGLDPEEIRKMVTQINQSEEAKLISQGKVDEVLSKRTETMRRDLEAKLTGVQSRADELAVALAERDQKLFNLQISNTVAQAAAGKVNPDAVPLVVGLAARVWKNEEGTLVPRTTDGTRWLGRDGRQDISAVEWIDSLKESFPSLFPAPSGGGARGGNGKALGADIENMNSLEKMNYGRKSHQ